MKIVVHIHKGCVYGVYHQREKKDAVGPMGVPDVIVVDDDCDGDAEGQDVEDIKNAPEEVREAVEAME